MQSDIVSRVRRFSISFHQWNSRRTSSNGSRAMKHLSIFTSLLSLMSSKWIRSQMLSLPTSDATTSHFSFSFSRSQHFQREKKRSKPSTENAFLRRDSPALPAFSARAFDIEKGKKKSWMASFFLKPICSIRVERVFFRFSSGLHPLRPRANTIANPYARVEYHLQLLSLLHSHMGRARWSSDSQCSRERNSLSLDRAILNGFQKIKVSSALTSRDGSTCCCRSKLILLLAAFIVRSPRCDPQN